ncbi:MAG: hypothetical protein OXK80_01150 [Bdellovibrionales bacterium]|nr:hypothetical protein [Bdellovibrionales bacterium]
MKKKIDGKIALFIEDFFKTHLRSLLKNEMNQEISNKISRLKEYLLKEKDPINKNRIQKDINYFQQYENFDFSNLERK